MIKNGKVEETTDPNGLALSIRIAESTLSLLPAGSNWKELLVEHDDLQDDVDAE